MIGQVRKLEMPGKGKQTDTMSIDITRTHNRQQVAAPGADAVIAFCPIPADSKVEASIQVELRGSDVGFGNAVAYGIDAYVVEIQDPDTVVQIDTLWDRFVPKAIAPADGVYDLDTTGAEVNAAFEPGDVNFELLIGSGDGPRRLYKRRKMVTFVGGNGQGFNWVTSNASTFIPTDQFSINVRSVRVEAPSYLLIGLSSPDLANKTETVESTLTELEWTTVQLAEWSLDMALPSLLGMIEVGAETPFTDVMTHLTNFMAPNWFEVATDRWETETWGCHTMAKYKVTVPGRLSRPNLRSD